MVNSFPRYFSTVFFAYILSQKGINPPFLTYLSIPSFREAIRENNYTIITERHNILF